MKDPWNVSKFQQLHLQLAFHHHLLWYPHSLGLRLDVTLIIRLHYFSQLSSNNYLEFNFNGHVLAGIQTQISLGEPNLLASVKQLRNFLVKKQFILYLYPNSTEVFCSSHFFLTMACLKIPLIIVAFFPSQWNVAAAATAYSEAMVARIIHIKSDIQLQRHRCLFVNNNFGAKCIRANLNLSDQRKKQKFLH